MVAKEVNLLTTARSKLSKGMVICILGWLPKNHDSLTKEFERTGKVKFFEVTNASNVQNNHFVIPTRFVSHRSIKALRTKHVWNTVHTIGEVKRVLNQCADLIFKQIRVREEIVPEPLFKEVTEEVIPTGIQELERIILEGEVVVDMYDKIAMYLKGEFEKCPSGIGTRTIAKTLRDNGSEITAKDLVRDGWLLPQTSPDSSKIGFYLPSEKLKKRMFLEREEEPKDGIEKAQFLLRRKPIIEGQVTELKKQIDELKKQLARCQAAEELLRQLEDI